MGLQLVTSFIGAAKILGVQRQTTQRQLTAEKKKNSEGDRVESLNKRLSETHEKITMLEEMMRKIFTGYFFLSFLFPVFGGSGYRMRGYVMHATKMFSICFFNNGFPDL